MGFCSLMVSVLGLSGMDLIKLSQSLEFIDSTYPLLKLGTQRMFLSIFKLAEWGAGLDTVEERPSCSIYPHSSITR